MHGDVECILWTDERAREQCGPNSTASNSLPYVDYGQLGIYCLTKDVYLPKDWTPYTWWGGTNSLTICLNGHTINGAGILGKDEATYNDITDQQSLTLMDCTEDASKRGSFGVYNSAGSKNSAILLKRGNNLTLSNVTLTGINCAKAAITVGDRATLNLCDGASIEYNKSTGDKQATIVINKGGTFNMTGGQIRDNKGYAGGVLNNGTFNMTGGSIFNNVGKGYGGTLNIGGTAKVYYNYKDGAPGTQPRSNVCMLNPESYPIHVSGLQSAAKIALNSWTDGIVQGKVTDETLDKTVAFAKAFAARTGAVVAVTGAIDIVADGERAFCIRNGHPMMSAVTGTGCQLSALTAAFCAANPDKPLEAAAAAVCAMGLAGEAAHSRLSRLDGNATYRNYIIDAIYNMTAEQLEEGARYEMR